MGIGSGPPGPSDAASSGVRLAEVIGTLSLAVDLGLGQPMGHVARSCLVAGRLGDRLDLDKSTRTNLYYVTLMGWVGCIADSPQVARAFGDDLEYRSGVFDIDMAPLPFLGYLLGRAGGGSPMRRIGVGAALVTTGAKSVQDSLRTHCMVTSDVAGRLGLGEGVTTALQQIFARWDGKGLPRGLSGEDIALPVRLWQLADVAEVHHARGGLDAAVAVARTRSGTHFDPHVVEAFCRHPSGLFTSLDLSTTFADVVASDPGLQSELTHAELDAALETLADFADLKSPVFGGHSRGVADLSAAAAEELKLRPEDVRAIRRAALLSDLGRTGVPNTIWDSTQQLTRAEVERIRMHSFYTERMLADGPLANLGAIAALAHERLDGSGYHRGLTGSSITMPGRVLAVAEFYHTKVEARPHRRALGPDEALRALEREVRDGRLDGDAAGAVLAAAGHGQRRPTLDASLTPREVEVLVLLARGATNRQIARRLGISPKTAGNHVEHIYAKAGVSSRATATLYAMRSGLLGSVDPID